MPHRKLAVITDLCNDESSLCAGQRDLRVAFDDVFYPSHG